MTLRHAGWVVALVLSTGCASAVDTVADAGASSSSGASGGADAGVVHCNAILGPLDAGSPYYDAGPDMRTYLCPPGWTCELGCCGLSDCYAPPP